MLRARSVSIFRDMETLHEGIILFFLPKKGYGYLRLAGTREEFHFKQRDVRYANVAAGQRVSFELSESRQGMRAINVSLSKRA